MMDATRGLVLLASILLVSFAGCTKEQNRDWVVSEKLIARIDFSSWVKESFTVSRDDKRFVVVNGKEGRPYDAIVALGESRIVFDSSSSLHYFALKNDDIYLVEAKVDGL